MIVRVMEFLNSFYRDNGVENEMFTNAQYCTLGYFDGLRTENLGSFSYDNNDKGAIRDRLYTYIIKNIDGQNSQRNVVCYIDEEEKDNQFWNENKSALLFVSLIRLKNSTTESFEELKNKIKQINLLEANRIVYYSTDHCEIVVVNKTRNYSEGITCIEEIHQNFNVFKMYSIFAIDEEILASESKLENKIDKNEFINCRFHISVNWNRIKQSEAGNDTKEKLKNNIEQFFTEVYRQLNLSEKPSFTMCNKLGNADLVVELNDILLYNLLKCYRKNSILRHSTEFYHARWFNIETELFLDKEVIEIGELA